jgi:hypothetical protein
MGIFGSFQLDVGCTFVCVCGSACAECAERGFRLVTSQVNKHPKKISTFKLRFVLVKRKTAFLSEGAWSFGAYFKSALPL